MATDVIAVKDASGVSRNVLVDNDGANNLTQVVKTAFGVEDAVPTHTSVAAPLPTRDPPYTRVSKGGGTSTGSSQVLVASNASRDLVEVSNGSPSGIWLAFGEAAVAGQGTYVPSKATWALQTSAEVRYIFEASGSGGAVGYTEWS
jgi:hypothetical protein